MPKIGIKKMFLNVGSSGDNVEKLQEKLKHLSFYDRSIDGHFGISTEKSVIKFQISSKINADGVVGLETARLLGLDFEYKAYPIPVPSSLNEIKSTFGDPMLSGYWSTYCGFCSVPSELNHVFTYQRKDSEDHGFYCNKLLIIAFQNVYKSIVSEGLSEHLKTFNGCYNVRNMRGRNKLSTHSWGIAVDHNAVENPLGSPSKMNVLKRIKSRRTRNALAIPAGISPGPTCAISIMRRKLTLRY